MARRVLVIGAGPAGASAAIFLAGKSLEVSVIDRRKRLAAESELELRIGESLPPESRTLLQQLGVWEAFESGPHLPCHGNKSYWGSDRAQYHDFMNHPLGCGWHIDRVDFERLLLRRAVDLGATLLEGSVVGEVVSSGAGWKVRFDDSNPGSRSGGEPFDFIVDATGRNSWFARREKIDRLVEDDSLALVTFLKTGKTIEDSLSLVELTASGWWYSAAIPRDKVATAFFCKPDKEERRRWVRDSDWWNLLAGAPHTNQRIRSGESVLIGTPKFTSAESGILERLHGRGWLAVGDAAVTFDPIASHGLMMAMVSARDAAHSIQRFFEGDEGALSGYEGLIWAAFQHYARERAKFY